MWVINGRQLNLFALPALSQKWLRMKTKNGFGDSLLVNILSRMAKEEGLAFLT
jgi:hypothetical protein